MQFENLPFLQRLGLSPAMLQSLLALAHDRPAARPARVLTVHRAGCVVHDGDAQLTVRAHPSLASTALAVGDWVLIEPEEIAAGDTPGACHESHASTDPTASTASTASDAADTAHPPGPRNDVARHGTQWLVACADAATEIVRRDADGRRHIVVSNVDIAFIVMGLDGDFNPRRAERFIALARGGGPGIVPVLVLTKRDWAGAAVADDEADAMRTRLGIAVEAVNGHDPDSALRLARYIAPGQTAVLLGSSGAGKSTLTNTLMGAPVEDTGAVRAADDRGKHTTTHRALYLLPQSAQCGGLIIDTPGVRTLRPDVDAQALGATFTDIEALAASCRFNDCRHRDEPGCAVRAGVDADRLANWHKLSRELKRDSMSQLERQRQLSEWKARSRGARERMKLKRGAA
jgi:ribosome biogenesis GTPase